MFQDLKFAVRLFARERGFFVATVLTIALGIGLAATVFAVVDGVLFRPLPYRDPHRLVALSGAVRAEQQFTMSVSWPDVIDWRAASRTLQSIEAYTLGGPAARIQGGDETTQVAAAAVTMGFFQALGVDPLFGRTLAPDDYRGTRPGTALISYRAWQGKLAADPAVIGKTIDRDGARLTIVGVLRRDFVFPASTARIVPDVFVPLIPAAPADRTSRQFSVIGRLAPAATIEQARGELDGIAVSLQPLFVRRPNVFPGAFDGVTVVDLRQQLTRRTMPALSMVFGAVAAVFAIACVNVIGLLLAHGEDRRREMAVRLALGAHRGAILRQLAVEGALLATAGAFAGWALSASTFGLIRNRIPAWTQLLGEPSLDARAAWFAALLAIVTLCFAALVPWLRVVRASPRPALADASRQISGRQRGRHLLICLQAAMATVLLLAGSVMVRSWVRLHSQETGLDADRVIAVRAVPPMAATPADRHGFNTRIAEALRRVPGVQSVDLLDMPLLQRAVKGSGFIPPRRVLHPAGMDTDVVVTPGYFDTMGITLLAGRGLQPTDRDRAVVVSEAFARRYWADSNPVGTAIRYRDGQREIVGVVNSARDVSLDSAPMPTLYHVWSDANPPVATFVLRFTGPADAVLAQVRPAVRGVDPGVAITMLATVADLLSTSVAERNFNTLLFAVFGVAALAVSLVGIYGLVAFVVARREREMGIRLALGATASTLKFFVISGTLRWVAAGVAAGVTGALALANALKPFVYQTAPNDPMTIAIAAIGFLIAAGLASYAPARRAARVDPMVALRAE